jgi:hypothetical protein
MAESVTQKLKRKKMISNDTQVEEVSGCVIGLGIRSRNKTGGGGAKVEVLDERCIVCCGDVKCWRHAYTGGSVVILEKAGCATVEEVNCGVIGMGITSRNKSAGGGVDATQSTEAKKKSKKKPRKFIKNNTTN